MLSLISGIGAIAWLIALIFFLIDAFQKEWWKGLLCLLCWPYQVYYMFAEFEHPNKPQLLVAYWLGGIVGGVLGKGLLR